MKLQNFFNPQLVAVIGASSDKQKVGFALMSNLVGGATHSSQGYEVASRKIFPVSISEAEILGLKTFKTVLEIPEEIDLAVIAVRADIVPAILKECATKKIKNVIVISAGFKEIGEAGEALEKELAKIARENGIALLGPNCLGTIDAENNFNSSFGGQKPLAGNIAFLSQSGALGTSLLDLAIKEAVGFSKFVSLGNEASLSELDFLEFLAEDKNTHSILIYLEKLASGRKFMELARKISETKPIVVLKAGRSARGMQAVASHTGSLAPEDAVFSSACRQSGIIAVESIREFFNMAKLFQNGFIKPIQNLAVLTNGGGPSVIAADLIDLSRSLSLAELSEATKAELRKVLPPMAAVGNPVDIIGDALSARYESALQILCAEKSVDGIILMLTPQMMTEISATAELLIKFLKLKPIIPVFLGGPAIESALAIFREHHLANFTFPKDAVEALDNLASVLNSSFLKGGARVGEGGGFNPPSPFFKGSTYSDREGFNLKEAESSYSREDFNKIPRLADSPLPLRKGDKSLLPKKALLPLKKGESELKMLPFAETAKLLAEYKISVAGTLAKEKTELKGIFEKLDGAPAVMKAISPDIIHKTDAVAVKLNLRNAEEAEKYWDEIVAKNPEAKLEGMLVQPMATGKETIVGMKRDATFGATILFGLGGIFTEVLRDTALRVAPVNKKSAEEMILEIRGAKILTGARGEKSVDISAIADLIVKISELALAHPEIQEMDFNPVMATPEGAEAVDTRIMK